MCIYTDTDTQGDGSPIESSSETHTHTNKKGETEAGMASKCILTTNQQTQTQNTKETHMPVGPIDPKK